MVKSSINDRIASLSPQKRAILEQALTKKSFSHVQTIPRRAEGDFCPLSFAQQRLWFLDQLEPGSSIYNIPVAVRLSGPLNLGVLEQCLNEVVRRHEAVRTFFRAQEGEPFQLISKTCDLCVPMIDLSSLPETERETQMLELVNTESQRPFDLSQDLMLRALLLRLGAEEHVLVMTMHHIASDGWSMGILKRELSASYQAFSGGEPTALAELPIQYSDYAVWQRQWLQGKELESQLAYWKKQLQGAPEVLELPTDRPRPAMQSFLGGHQPLKFPKELTEKLKALSRKEGVTLFMTLLAAFQTLLHRYTGQQDIVVGAPMAGRNQMEVEGLIGFFVNTLVLRTRVSPDLTFRELLKRVREVALGAYEHQELPFEKLVDELQPARHLSHNPLFQVMFAMQNAPGRGLDLLGLMVTPVEIERRTAKFDLTLSLADKEEGLSGSMEYNTDLYDAATIERMLGHFQVLLQGVTTTPEEKISNLPLLTEGERHELLVDWNSTVREYPQEWRIHELFEEQVETTPHAVAVTYGDESLTYQELNRQANQLGHYLKKLEVGADVLVGLCVERSIQMVVGLLGILKAGGAYVPLDPAYPEERLRFMLDDAGIKIVLTQKSLTNSVSTLDKDESGTGEKQAKPEIGSAQSQIGNRTVIYLDTDWEKIAQEGVANLKSEGTAANLAYVIYTSGSTGKPKGVQIPHQAVVNFLDSMRKEPGLTKRDKMLSVTTLSFDIAGLELFLPLTVGGRVILVSREVSSDGRELREHLAKSEATAMQATPITWRMLLEAGWQGNHQLKILCGGEALSRDLANELVEKGASVWNLYGPTETTIWSAVSQVRQEQGTVFIGRPIANTQIFLLDSHLQPVPIGVPGELYIGGDGLARGYWNRPELTAEKFIPNPFASTQGARLYRTGDLARFREDGNVEYMGRIDHQMKIRGFRIELGEIESSLSHHEAVREAVVILRKSDHGEEQLVAYVAKREKDGPGSVELRDFLKKKLPDYMVPSAFVTLDSIPRLPNGKLDRSALPAPSRDCAELELSSQFPQDELELQLKMIWEEVLNLRPIGVKDNFFEAGGNSFLAVRLFAQIDKRLGKKLPLATLFQATTIEDLAAILRQKGWSPPWASLVPIQPQGLKPPFFCVHAHRGEVLVFRDLARHLGMDQPFYGLQARGLGEEEHRHTRIEEMAEHYLQEIRALQSAGPYYLGGLCFGGKVALEMAHRLVEKGEKVALLAVLDAFAPGYPQLLPWTKRAIIRFNFHFQNLRRLRSGDRMKYVLEKIGIVRTRIGEILKRSVKKSNSLIRSLSWDSSRDQIQVRGRTAYLPKVYPGRITVFSPSEQIWSSYHMLDMGWAKFAGDGLEIHVIPGRYASIISEPEVGVMAEKLGSCLARARVEANFSHMSREK